MERVRLANAVRAREVSVVEVVEATLAAAERHRDLAAFVTRLDGELRASAVVAQRMVDEGATLGPLHGVPFSVKDVLSTAGVRTTVGSSVFAEVVPRDDATAVARLRAAGGLLVGKTNCPELAFGTTCESPVGGRTLSPYGSRFTPGGSSGGEAVSVATGSSAVGLGGDYGGSLRWPAQCTGVTALRPTPGRVPGTGHLPGLGGSLGMDGPALVNPGSVQGALQVVGPMARNVADLAVVLAVICGADGADPTASPVPFVPDGGAPAQWRIAWSSGAAIAPVRREVAELVARVAAQLEGVVGAVEEEPEALVGAHEAFNEWRSLDPLADQVAALSEGVERCSPFIRELLASVPSPNPVAESRARRRAAEARLRGLALFDHYDALLVPVAGGPAAAIDGQLDVDGVPVSGFAAMAHCRAVSLLGAPAVSVPVGTSREGLPLSVQVVTRPWGEASALAVAALLESLADA